VTQHSPANNTMHRPAPPSDDFEIALVVKMPATLRDAIGRAADARRESVSQFVREAIRSALRADGEPTQ
jgi:uncharacterized protein (DUF1778 family)